MRMRDRLIQRNRKSKIETIVERTYHWLIKRRERENEQLQIHNDTFLLDQKNMSEKCKKLLDTGTTLLA